MSADTNSNYDHEQHSDNKGEEENSNEKWRQVFELTLYPAMKKILLPQKKCVEEKSFLKITSLPDLYKVFERC